MYSKFIYELETVDDFTGMIQLKDYINIFINKEHHLSERSLKAFILSSFMELKTSECHWDGDVRRWKNGYEIYIGFIPRLGIHSPHKFLIFKQDNKGHTFYISETRMNIHNPDSNQIIKMSDQIRNFDKQKLISIFYESYNLLEEVYNDIPKQRINISNNKIIISEDKIFKFDTEKEVEKIKQQSISEIDDLFEPEAKKDIFNKSNYVQL